MTRVRFFKDNKHSNEYNINIVLVVIIFECVLFSKSRMIFRSVFRPLSNICDEALVNRVQKQGLQLY